MNKRIKRIITVLLTLSMSGVVLAGCTSNKAEETKAKVSGVTGEIKYPLTSKTTFKYWVPLNANVAASKKGMGDTEFAKELEKKTGVKVSFVHPVQGQEKEQFNLLVAGGNIPDLVEWDWSSFPGGPEKAIKDGYIVKLNDYIDKYAPNLKKYLKDHPDVDKLCKTDSGKYYSFPFIRSEDALTVFYGPIMRADWLKELGLEAPTTIAEWETVLTAFKEKKGVAAPLSFEMSQRQGVFSGAYGVTKGYYVDNGIVKFGPVDPAYKDFLATMNRWYSKGLLDKNCTTVDGKIATSNMLSGKSGASLGYIGGSIGVWLNGMKDKDPKYDLVAVPCPTLNKGEIPKISPKQFKVSGVGVSISAKCKDIETAVRYLDYGYSKEGELLNNFGIENESYKMDNGHPKYTDKILKNEEKLSIAQALARYSRVSYAGPFIQQKEYIDQFYQLQQQKDAIKVWTKTDADKHNLPPISPLIEEASELVKIDGDISTYVDEMETKFITGAEPLSKFDSFVSQIKKLNIDKSIKIKQSALERYNKR